jgi:hypothetical protein
MNELIHYGGNSHSPKYFAMYNIYQYIVIQNIN